MMFNHYINPESFPVQLEKNLFMLGNYFFNIFLITGTDKTVLFETGISAVVDTVIDQIEKIGKKPDYLIPSHPHSDHITGLCGLAEKYPDAVVITADGAKEFVEHPKASLALIKEDRYLHDSIMRYDLVPGRDPLNNIPDLSNCQIVYNQETLDLGNISLELSRVEGHSPGNLMGFIPEYKTVLCSDSLGFHYPGRGFFPLFFTGLENYLATINSIKALEPWTVCPGHQGPVQGKNVFPVIEKALQSTFNIVEKANQHSSSHDILVQQLFEKYYVDEFTLYSEANIKNCIDLVIKRARE